MIDIARVLKSPAGDKRWIAKIAVGGAIPLIPVLSFLAMLMTASLAAQAGRHAVPAVFLGAVSAITTGIFVLSPLLNFFPFGFIVARARKARAGGGDELPEWQNAKKLFVDGAAYFLIYFVYTLIPFLLAVWGVYFPVGGAGGVVVRFSTGILSILLLLGAGYLIPMAVCNFAVKDSLRAAFCADEIFRKIKEAGKDYASAYALSIGLFMGIYIVSLFLGVVIIGWLLFPFLMFYAKVALAKLFMDLYPGDESEYLDEIEAEVVEQDR